MVKTQVNVISFFSAYNRSKTIACCSGVKEVDDYSLQFDKDLGCEIVKPNGKKLDIYQVKQDALDGTYLPRMIERFTNGSISAEDFEAFKNPTSWTDIDVTSLPKSLAEMQQLQIDSENAFNSLPSEFRDLFGNSKFKFVEAMQNGSAIARLTAAGFIKSAANQSKLEKKQEKVMKESDGVE